MLTAVSSPCASSFLAHAHALAPCHLASCIPRLSFARRATFRRRSWRIDRPAMKSSTWKRSSKSWTWTRKTTWTKIVMKNIRSQRVSCGDTLLRPKRRSRIWKMLCAYFRLFFVCWSQLERPLTRVAFCLIVVRLSIHNITNRHCTQSPYTAPARTFPNSPLSATFSKARPPRLVSSKSKPRVKRCSTMAIFATKKPVLTLMTPRLSSGSTRYWSSARRITRRLRTGWSRCTMISSKRDGLE